MRLPTRIGVVTVAAGTLAGLVLSATANATPAPRATLTGSVPPWATSSSFKGDASTSGTVGFRVYLGWRDAAQAEALATAVSTPGSAAYGRFLTSAQFRQRFAPTQSDVTAVQRWLRSAGFTVDYTPANNHYVQAEGTVGQANAAFSTRLGTYAYAGRTLRAPERPLTVPASLPNVSGVIGLDDSASLVQTDHVSGDATPPPAPGFRNAPPLPTVWGGQTTATTPVPATSTSPLLAIGPQSSYVVASTASTTLPDYSGAPRPYAPKGYTPDQLRAAYGLGSSDNGAGQTVAIIDAYASPTIVKDVNTYFDTDHQGSSGLYPPLTPANFQQVVAPGTFNRAENPRQDPQGWWGEETLDVEAVHAMAPQADIVYVGAPNNYQDLDAALNHVVDRHLATIVTNSYGWLGEALPYGFIKPVYDTMVEAAATGIGVYFSSGDNGDNTGGSPSVTPQPDWPASSPWVTAVGGTSLEWTGSARTEYGWQTEKASLHTTAGSLSWGAPAYMYGGGGGISRPFARPTYQDAAVAASGVSSVASSTGRVVPDVSLVGDPTTGMLVGQTQTFPDGAYYDEYRIGGTSLSSPLMAGVMATVQQHRGSVIGFANPLLYAAGASAYVDITPAPAGESAVRVDYANGVDGSDGLLASIRTIGFEGLQIHTGTGYDDVTGLGTPSGSFLTTLASVGK